MNYGIHWFRRDLRVAGNKALRKNFSVNQGKVLGLFCFDKKFLGRSDFSANRFAFFLETLSELKAELQELGGDLLVLDVGPEEAFTHLLSGVVESPSLITWSRDYEPFARERDQHMEQYFTDRKIEFSHSRDHLIVEPWELERDKGFGYKVYTPFSKKWLSLFQTEEFQLRVAEQKMAINYFEAKLKGQSIDPFFSLKWKEVLKRDTDDWLESYRQSNGKHVTIDIPAAGSLNAYKKLKSFASKIQAYDSNRDIPSLDGTSGLSHFLKNGSLTTSLICQFFQLAPYSEKKTGRDIYLSELIWREFYYHILYRYPAVEKNEFNQKYSAVKWSKTPELLEKWKKGQTGYPIVDAGMRQLNQTGFMHNRVRMIVASFLVKHLLIDWREGENYFMEKLLDGDLAPNNGGWQWAASTGCDAQPYFRIFNPWSQSKKFDPKGEYIRKYCPELKDLPDKELHLPIMGHAEYPEPIIEHKMARARVLEAYKSL